MKTQTKENKKNLGIYYTPEPVVELVFAILNIWKKKEDQKTGRWSERGHYPSVIDPACGEGIFLKKAIESGFTKPKMVWGVDIDEGAYKRWGDINLFKYFNSKSKPEHHFFCQDGLLPVKNHIRYRYKRGGGLDEFDAVVGNPPYGGIGITEIDKELEAALLSYGIWKRAIQNNGNKQQEELVLTGGKLALSKSIKERIKRFPIEVLFLDRFIQLAKDGGWIAMVIPDGILANENLLYVRNYVSEIAKLEAVISLPRGTFKGTGTSAKTSILFLKKTQIKKENYPVFLASTKNLDKINLDKIIELYGDFYDRD